MSVYTNRHPCWEVDLGGDYTEHHPNGSAAEENARQLAADTDRTVSQLDRPCSGAVCDECGTDYEDDDTGSPVHFTGRDAVLDAIDNADWTTDDTGTLVHCQDCPPLPERPLRWTSATRAGIPLPGL